MRLTARTDEGYTGRKLWKRVWGDMKDLYGREWRRFYAEPKPPGQTGMPSPGRVTSEAEQGLKVDVRAAVALLKPGQRDVVERIAFLGMSHEEAAKDMGLNTQAVTMRYARARRRLAELLEAYAP